MLKRPAVLPSRRQLGVSLVEMMVGMAVGLVVVAGAALMAVNQVSDHRRLRLETVVQQDLRAAADMIMRDLRRSGFWTLPDQGVWASGAAAPVANPHTEASAPASGREVLFSYSRPTDTNVNNRDDNELGGYKLDNGVLKLQLGKDNWQPLTDRNTLIITDFRVGLETQNLALDEFCTRPCPASSPGCPPVQQVRHVNLYLAGEATHDAEVKRSVQLSTRLRNDHIKVGC